MRKLFFIPLCTKFIDNFTKSLPDRTSINDATYSNYKHGYSAYFNTLFNVKYSGKNKSWRKIFEKLKPVTQCSKTIKNATKIKPTKIIKPKKPKGGGKVKGKTNSKKIGDKKSKSKKLNPKKTIGKDKDNANKGSPYTPLMSYSLIIVL